MALCDRSDEWGAEWDWLRRTYGTGKRFEWYLRLIFKAGRDKVRVIITEEQATDMLSLGPWLVSALSHYRGYIFDEEVIEAAIVSPGVLPTPIYSLLRNRAWMQTEGLEYSKSQLRDFALYPPPWLVGISNPSSGAKVEIGSASARFSALSSSLSNAETIRISGIPVHGHDQALKVLEEIRNDIAFEFDLRYGAGFELLRRPTGRASSRTGQIGHDLQQPTWPQNRYSTDALSLYWYARSAINLPLLEFLAYYQVLEFYFSHHIRRQSIIALREELKDPRFRSDSDDDLSRILRIASNDSGTRNNEEEQLQAALRGTVSKENLLSFISSQDSILDSLTGKRILDGVPQLNLQDKGSDVRDQLARRIYAIRCRVVHSKADGGARRSVPLLPFSQEAGRLDGDIQVLRFLAQKAIIAGSTPRPRTE
ncbi:hypothetical protein ACIA49_00315 [Kribbella sp. NPDC051587]|uniref:hypothetical protein n=1 Tax=Kribbella sp. NPDC051587 TaxID=3364119 RepID=UPI0037B3285A